MKIFYCTDLLLENNSAPTVHVDVICREFRKLGHAVTLYAPGQGSFQPAYRTVRIPAPRFLLSLFFQPQLFVRLLLAMLRERPDLMYVRHSHLLLVPSVVGRLFNVPTFLEVNGILEQDAVHINETLLSRLLLSAGIFALLERINARLATRVIAVTTGIKDFFVVRYGTNREKIVVIPNGVDTDFFRPLARRNARLTVGYLGSLHAWQGVRHIVEAAALLPGFHFRIIGKGEEEESLAAIIREKELVNVELLPAIRHEEVPAAINSFDVCISYPLKFRDGATSPFKVYEYLACGKLVISSDLAGMREEFGDVLTYAKAESHSCLAEKIQELANNPGRRETLGKKGRAFVEDGKSWQAVAATILSLLSCRR